MQQSKEDLNRIKKVNSISYYIGVNLQNTKTTNKIDQWEIIKHLQRKDNWIDSTKSWEKIAGSLEFILS